MKTNITVSLNEEQAKKRQKLIREKRVNFSYEVEKLIDQLAKTYKIK